MNNIDLYIQELETSKVEIKEAIIAKGVTPEGGLSSYAAAINSIEDPTLETDDLGVLINENGSYYYTPEGDGFTSVSVTVDVIPPPVITQEKDVTITSNGETIVTPDSGFDGLNKVNISVEVAGGDAGKPKIYNGFVLNGTDYDDRADYTALKEVDFSQYDWSDVYDLSYFFGNFYGALSSFRWSAADFANFNEHYNGKVMACQYIVNPATGTGGGYLGSTGVLSFLNNRMHDCLDMSNMFNGCSNLTSTSSMASWDTSNVVTTYYMFSGCSSLTTVTLFDTSNVRDMSFMFQYCSSLTTIPLFDTSNVTSMSYMFQGCASLTSVPLFDTSNVTNMGNMFSGCDSLTTVPLFDTSNVTNMGSMFQGCSGLTSVPELDFSNVAGIMNIFQNCTQLKELPNINCKKLASFNSNWYSNKTEKIGIIDCDSVTNVNYLFTNSTVMTDAGGCRNLGMQSSVSNTNGNYFLYNVPNLTHDSLLNVFNLLYDRAAAGYSVLTIKLHPTQMGKLSDDDKLIATNKGWSLTV